ncbi:MAG: NADP oxidoreductase [Devosia sp. 67-54]|uniref:NADPH-dependent F420 reductase n=1 Tax=unclassified Devosia TaxID=196773 RepID=UPI00095D779A|nr:MULTISPECIES: NAD(P)-binding domain-containing protein [unclassified Devosia]MBN9306435.1 NAD(P)-binding domain-containing protein [Devosia sp.]OJX18488.1 MAG: NADP oxidoreductase [Devosia sp. 67-54]
MKIGVLGTGAAGQTIGTRLVAMGHDVMMGARAADNEKVVGFARRTGGKAGTFADAARHGEMVLNCTRGDKSVGLLSLLANELSGKVLLDVANPLDFSNGYPPHLSVVNTDSLGEQIQRALPATFVVKSLNTVNAEVMMQPGRVPGNHTIFVSGNDKAAKGRVMDFLRSLGWHSIIDLGDITSARAAEQILPLWVRLYSVLGTADFNIAVMKA